MMPDETGRHDGPDDTPTIAATTWGCVSLQAVVALHLCWLRAVAAWSLPHRAFYHAIFFHLLAVVDWAGALLNVLLTTVSVLAASRFPQCHGFIACTTRWLGDHVAAVAVTMALAWATMCKVVYDGYPLTWDEFAPVFQAEAFAAGRPAGHWPTGLIDRLIAEENNGYFLNASRLTGDVISAYQPGHAVLLVPYTLLGIPWLCNPVLLSGALWLMADVAGMCFGRSARGWAVLLCLASPTYTAFASGFYSMPAHLAANMLYAWLLLRGGLLSQALAGAVGGFALSLHNPFPHAVFALPWLVWTALKPRRIINMALLLAGYSAVFLSIDHSWARVKAAVAAGHPLNLVVDRPQIDVGEAARGVAGDHAPGSAVQVIQNRLVGLAGHARAAVAAIWSHVGSLRPADSWRDFFWSRWASLMRLVAWDAPGLVPLAVFGALAVRRNVPACLLAMSAAVTFTAYSLVPFSGGHGWGYRYFFPAWGCLPILAAGLATSLSAFGAGGPTRATARLLAAIGLSAVMALIVCVPLRCWQIHSFMTRHRMQSLEWDPAVRAQMLRRAVIFIDPVRGHFKDDLIRNPAFIEDDSPLQSPFLRLVSRGFHADEELVLKLAERESVVATLVAERNGESAWLISDRPRLPSVTGTED